MHIGEISFCDSIGYNIKSDELKSRILNEISEKYNKKIIEKHYDKFTDSSYALLNARPYIMCLRSNGNPYFLYLTKIGGVNQCVFIDKKIQVGYMYPRMVIVKLWFNEALFTNTLFEGEMVKSNGKWTFLLHDIYVKADASLIKINVIKRYNMMYEVLSNEYKSSYQDICCLKIKKLFHYNDPIVEFKDTLPYTSRGIYFMPLYFNFKQILFNFNDDLITRKERKVKSSGFKETRQHDGVGDKMSLQTQLSSRPPQPPAPAPAPAPLSHQSHQSPPARPQQSQPPPPQQPPQRKLCTMYLQKTSIIDVYKVYKEKSDTTDTGVAFVNTMNISKKLRNAFLNSTPIDKIGFECKYRENFKKWEPISGEPL
jgi:hypothetical protein